MIIKGETVDPGLVFEAIDAWGAPLPVPRVPSGQSRPHLTQAAQQESRPNDQADHGNDGVRRSGEENDAGDQQSGTEQNSPRKIRVPRRVSVEPPRTAAETRTVHHRCGPAFRVILPAQPAPEDGTRQ